MGRDSFRMQVTDAGAVPSTIWDGATTRIVDRRKHDRRKAPREAAESQEEESLPVPPARNTVIGIALMTFACGVMVATAFNQFPLRGGAPVHAAAVTPAPAPQPPAVVVQPLPKPAPPPAPVVAPVAAPIAEVVAQPEAEPQPEQPAVVAKAKPAVRVVAARAVHPRRPAPSPSTAAAASETPAAAPRPTRPWVDPFAE